MKGEEQKRVVGKKVHRESGMTKEGREEEREEEEWEGTRHAL